MHTEIAPEVVAAEEVIGCYFCPKAEPTSPFAELWRYAGIIKNGDHTYESSELGDRWLSPTFFSAKIGKWFCVFEGNLPETMNVPPVIRDSFPRVVLYLGDNTNGSQVLLCLNETSVVEGAGPRAAEIGFKGLAFLQSLREQSVVLPNDPQSSCEPKGC